MLQGVLSFKDFCDIVDTEEKKGECLLAGRDVRAVQYIEGQRVDGSFDAEATCAQGQCGGRVPVPVERGTVEQLFAEGHTLQVLSILQLGAALMLD